MADFFFSAGAGALNSQVSYQAPFLLRRFFRKALRFSLSYSTDPGKRAADAAEELEQAMRRYESSKRYRGDGGEGSSTGEGRFCVAQRTRGHGWPVRR